MLDIETNSYHRGKPRKHSIQINQPQSKTIRTLNRYENVMCDNHFHYIINNNI
jgi:hypothetical protein